MGPRRVHPSGQVVAEVAPPTPTCPFGSHWNGTTCVPDCPGDQVKLADGTCGPRPSPCPEGQLRQADGSCAPPAEGPSVDGGPPVRRVFPLWAKITLGGIGAVAGGLIIYTAMTTPPAQPPAGGQA